jgi:serine/threonine protein kinase
LPNGTRLFEFEIGSVLGHGGFGITYRAVDTLLQEDVAIKEFLPNELAVRVSDETVKAKSAGDQDSFKLGLTAFLEEARMIARFRHPNIMQVRRFFELHGTGYIVLEYERGRTLSQVLAQGPIAEAELRLLLLNLLNGLEAVHNRGILHRDLKPSNVIIRDNGPPVLIDFGAARDFTSRHSRSITAIAAPGYSPPEQYGVGGQQGPWSDFYALGAILYRCVTGAPPADSLRRLRKDPVVPASVAAAGKFDPGFLKIIDWMLEVDEAKRPESVEVLRQAIETGRVPDGDGAGTGSKEPSTSITAVRLSKGEAGAAVLEFEKASKADILDLAFHAAPPGRYLSKTTAGKISWSEQPQYVSLDRIGGSGDRASYLLEPDLAAALPAGSRVEITSSDDFIRAKVDWISLVDPNPGNNRLLKTIAALLALFVVTAAVAMNLDALGDVSCSRLGYCTADRVAFAQSQSCVTAAKVCEAKACTAKFKSDFQGSRLVARIIEIDDQSDRRCRASEDAEFDSANRCAEPKMTADPCGVASCFQGINSRPDSRNAAVAKNMIDRAKDSCSRAQERSSPPAVAAPQPATPVIQPEARAPDPIPQFTPPPPPPPPPQPTGILPNGRYLAIQSYTGPKSRTDPRNCPPFERFYIEVRGGAFTYSRPDFKDGVPITRYWNGNIDQTTGRIAIMGSSAVPPTKNALTIGGMYSEAALQSDFCGIGTFKIQR